MISDVKPIIYIFLQRRWEGTDQRRRNVGAFSYGFLECLSGQSEHEIQNFCLGFDERATEAGILVLVRIKMAVNRSAS